MAELHSFIMAWLDVVVDFLRLVGLNDLADDIASKIVMPL